MTTNTQKALHKYLRHVGFMILVFFASLMIRYLMTPVAWGRPRMAQKIDYLMSHPGKYNTLIMGSSKVDCNYDPKEFDKSVQPTVNTKTFNLGCNGSTIDENYIILKNLVKEAKGINRIFFQITRPRIMALEEETIESRYYLDYDVTKILCNYANNNTALRSTIIKKYLYNLLNIGEVFKRFSIKRKVKKLNDIGPMLHVTHGFFNTDLEVADWVIIGRAKRNNPRWVPKMENQLSNYRTAIGRQYNLSGALLDLVIKIDRLCGQNNIECIFFSVPGEKIGLPADMKYIYMGDGPDHPDYFQLDNHLDHVHVKPAGAKIYSQVLARKFLALK